MVVFNTVHTHAYLGYACKYMTIYSEIYSNITYQPSACMQWFKHKMTKPLHVYVHTFTCVCTYLHGIHILYPIK